ncbi:hypothetical protein E3C22_18285 [Jiella endophytica]|uniref:Uncharacterized protein n=1 Tax=Jiella endophytica TaxID=2558362 RepID=A0A4Y8RGY1_9HYPH|nr:hypothetical protein [Jiella endophytica]TFF20837.1 hypothetical protein E3C22_18285 [Jiella endophytica]
MDLSNLDLEKAANALLILITGLLTFFGIRRGMRGGGPASPAKPEHSTFEVAGAIVDSSAVRMLSREVTGQAIAITDQTKAIRDDTDVRRQQIETVKDQTRALLTLEEEIKELRHELSRRRG